METNREHIFLVPTDFSEVCTNAARRAASLAKEVNYKIALLHVVDKNTKAELKKENKGVDWIENKLKALADMLKDEYGIQSSIFAKEGDIFSTIANVAQELNAQLIFLGTHGKVGMQKLTGSFALKVVLSSEVPTIVVQKRQYEKGFDKIVLPMTSDSGPWNKTKWAAYIAKEFNAEILILTLPSDEMDDVTTMISNHFKVNDVKYSIKIADKGSSFTKQVIDYATETNSGLIMIMTSPDKGLGSFFLGSYDEDLIFNPSQIPVMCINPRDFNWKKIVPR